MGFGYVCIINFLLKSMKYGQVGVPCWILGGCRLVFWLVVHRFHCQPLPGRILIDNYFLLMGLNHQTVVHWTTSFLATLLRQPKARANDSPTRRPGMRPTRVSSTDLRRRAVSPLYRRLGRVTPAQFWASPFCFDHFTQNFLHRRVALARKMGWDGGSLWWRLEGSPGGKVAPGMLAASPSKMCSSQESWAVVASIANITSNSSKLQAQFQPWINKIWLISRGCPKSGHPIYLNPELEKPACNSIHPNPFPTILNNIKHRFPLIYKPLQ